MPAHKAATIARTTASKPRPRASKWLESDPEYEAHKSARRNLSHKDAVAECAFLSAQYRSMWRARAIVQVDFKSILKVLSQKKIPFLLTGAHGISGWTGRPRSTHDVDILVRAGRNHARAVKAIKTLYPQLEARLFPAGTAFFVPGETLSVVDVTYPKRGDQMATIETAIWVEEEGTKYRVPSLEAALANKYGAMLSFGRDSVKRGQDAVDFAAMVKHSQDEGRHPIDLEKLAALGEMVWPGGGGKEILRLVEEAKAGTVPSLIKTRND
ncbi:MAG: nucleotidyl transferase AbiEii/AbiGii toxin family protein [Gemmataceae bacterium]|nr:nucleotidyl transferase AbiEii/AbiGii toxin family protein [Gemmataceae bacterium]MCI0739108.1 nucleotidyl transferase AbiEii/AbiGii toxin family protein [Gemmataceae bacterium]